MAEDAERDLRFKEAVLADLEELERDEDWRRLNDREAVVGDVYDPERGSYGPHVAAFLQREPEEREIVAVQKGPVGGPLPRPGSSHVHITAVELRDGTRESAAAVITSIKAHDAHYVMVPPPGAPAYEAHAETGLKLLVQVRQCGVCGQEHLFA